MHRLLGLIVKNTRRNLRRSLFTAGGLAVSLFLFTALLTVVSSLDALLDETGKNPLVIVTHKAGWAHVMPEAHGAKIERLPGVLAMARYLFYGGSYGQAKGPQDSFPSMGTDGADPRKIWGEQLVIGEDALACYRRERTAALVGSQLVARYGWKVGQRIALQGAAWPVDLTFTLCGEANFATDKGSFIFHREYLEAALGNPGWVSMFAVQVASAADIPEVARRISETFAATPEPVRAVSQRNFLENFMSMMGNVRGVVTGVAFLVVIAVLLLCANSVAMSTRERTVELSVLKALGFEARHVMALVVGEAAALALAGGLVGCGAAYAVFGGTGFSLGFGFLSGFTVTPATLAKGLVAALVVAVLAALLPALRVVRLRVTEGLREVV